VVRLLLGVPQPQGRPRPSIAPVTRRQLLCGYIPIAPRTISLVRHTARDRLTNSPERAILITNVTRYAGTIGLRTWMGGRNGNRHGNALEGQH
jgi:hypothetical protein